MDQEILFEKLDKVIALLETSADANLISYILAAFSVLAVVVAGVAVCVTIRNFRVSIKLEKIEEIFRSIEGLSRIYSELNPVLLSLNNYYEKTNEVTKGNRLNEYKKERADLLERVQIQDYFGLVVKIEILAKSYLSKNTQLKVLAFSRMFRDLLDYLVNMNSLVKEMFWLEGFPTISNMNQYTDDLGSFLVNEIGVVSGNKKIREELRFYTEVTFKRDVGTKK